MWCWSAVQVQRHGEHATMEKDSSCLDHIMGEVWQEFCTVKGLECQECPFLTLSCLIYLHPTGCTSLTCTKVTWPGWVTVKHINIIVWLMFTPLALQEALRRFNLALDFALTVYLEYTLHFEDLEDEVCSGWLLISKVKSTRSPASLTRSQSLACTWYRRCKLPRVPSRANTILLSLKFEPQL